MLTEFGILVILSYTTYLLNIPFYELSPSTTINSTQSFSSFLTVTEDDINSIRH